MKPAIISLLLLALCAALPAAQVGDPMEDKGTLIPLGETGSLQLLVNDEKKLVAYFIDTERRVMESPAESIVFVVDHPGNKNDKFRTVLVQSEDAGMIGPRALYPPYQLKSRLIIRLKDGDSRAIPYVMVELDRDATAALAK